MSKQERQIAIRKTASALYHFCRQQQGPRAVSRELDHGATNRVTLSPFSSKHVELTQQHATRYQQQNSRLKGLHDRGFFSLPHVTKYDVITKKALLMKKHTPLAERYSRGISLREKEERALEMILALKTLHEAGYVHRDVKIENYLLSENDELLLSDFESLIQQGEALSEEDQFGTPAYTSPTISILQYFRSHTDDPSFNYLDLINKANFKADDVWCLGMALFQLLHDKYFYTELLPDANPSDIASIVDERMNFFDKEDDQIEQSVHEAIEKAFPTHDDLKTLFKGIFEFKQKQRITASELFEKFTAYLNKKGIQLRSNTPTSLIDPPSPWYTSRAINEATRNSPIFIALVDMLEKLEQDNDRPASEAVLSAIRSQLETLHSFEKTVFGMNKPEKLFEAIQAYLDSECQTRPKPG